ncbi:N-acetyltransferase [Fusibacter ferrireducens]|uniref:N-acetyltransferase n=1 Tax=Fusibacter ferrireducens TaxID=2785058 RepID=A0ABR9ZNM5_9FIRM|nr:N-acetyltransferase [Fusibacter ferrireducens]MBF4692068.1 N-acetyltransferase [Fusibacter ferrireducens]
MIRRMNNIDNEINEVMDIWLESTIKAHDFIPEDYWRKNYDMVKDVYIPQSETYLYIEDGKILGFVSIINKEFIGALFVSRRQQGMGIGKKLIEFSKALYKVLSLAVYKENYQAVRFYESVGFKCIREQLNEDTNEAEYIMSTD